MSLRVVGFGLMRESCGAARTLLIVMCINRVVRVPLNYNEWVGLTLCPFSISSRIPWRGDMARRKPLNSTTILS